MAAIGLVALIDCGWAQENDNDSPRYGLVASYRSGDVEVQRIEPTVELLLHADQSPHPRLPPQGWSARWQGRIQVLRAGTYRFGAALSGSLRVSVGDQQVVDGQEGGDVLLGPATELKAGVHRFAVQFRTTQPLARVRLFWQSEQFPPEPVPWQLLSHSADDESPVLHRSQQQDRGRFLAEELSCTACHAPFAESPLAAGLKNRAGPDLSQVGNRVFARWILDWLENPQRYRAQAVMPRLFSDNDAGYVQRYAVAAYLASLGGRLEPSGKSPDDLENILQRGQATFSRVGCVACHVAVGGEAPVASLDDLASKTTAERLAEFLRDPLRVDPSGRMPDLGLSNGESRDVAYFLGRLGAKTLDYDLPDPPAAAAVLDEFHRIESGDGPRAQFAALGAPEQIITLGRKLVTHKGCTNCHRIAPGGAPVPLQIDAPAFASLREDRNRGCLHEAAPLGKIPHFTLRPADRIALREFLRVAGSGPGTAAPTFAMAVTLERFHCLRCHQRNGKGGLTAEVLDAVREYETAQEAEQITPPPLTETGAKLQTTWLRAVLTERRRTRPWMALRMPQFGADNVGHVAEALAAVDGVPPGDESNQFDYDPEAIEAGRFLTGKNAFGCISCHDIAGWPNTGTRGPDLATAHQRIRYEWFRRWLFDAQRMQPGTRMPTVFAGGKSPLRSLLDGAGATQAEAIWRYLSLGENLPLPDGVQRSEPLALVPEERPLVVRTFLPDAGSRALAVGFRGGVSFAFDAAQCRTSYGWTGGFLDASPIWNARGGRPARLLGPRFWTAPPGFPWALTRSEHETPDWARQAHDPAFGAPLPLGQLRAQPSQIVFRGYRIDQAGMPTFRYAMDSGAGRWVEIQQRIVPHRNLAGVGLVRRMTLELPAELTAWLLVGASDEPVQVLDAHGEPMADGSKDSHPAASHHLLLEGGSDHPVLVSLSEGPETAEWVLQHQGEQWYAVLRVAHPGDGRPVQLTVVIASPYRNDAAMIRALIGAERRDE